ncbi:MAG TPA: hypothetical protein VF746_30750 [Longimicrobium sp.]|jgi:hypothetical protein
MPRISRIRYVNLGHEKARMEDLTLDLRDIEGSPTDTAIWLDNGGGKSSMLALFFSVMRPALRDFLGARAEHKSRKLDDYVRAGDHSLVIGEWVMDETEGGLFPVPIRLVTGVFIERSQTPGEESKLDRTFFSFRVRPDQPRLTLEGLPVYQDGAETGTSRWTRAGFRLQMGQLRGENPLAQVYYTENQTEWTGHLDAQGIDTELFLYQVMMNLREGGAGDLFKFKDVEEFVDFFVRVVMNEKDGEELGSTLIHYRDDLKKRRVQLLPERKLVHGLIERFRSLLDVHERRSEMTGRIAAVAGTVAALRSYISEAITAKVEEAAVARAEAESALRDAATTKELLAKRSNRVIVARHVLTERQVVEAKTRDDEARRDFDAVTRALSVATLAVPLSRAMRHRKSAADLEEQLQMARSAHAPLLERLREAATSYAGALLHRIRQIDMETGQLREQARESDEIAKAAREAARTHERAETEAASRCRNLRDQEHQAEIGRARLVEQGALAQGEALGVALQRWRDAERRAGEDFQAHVEKLQALREEQGERAQVITSRQQDANESARALDAARTALQTAQSEREALETDEMVLEVMRTDRLDLDRTDDATLRRVAQAGEREQTELFGLWSEKARTEHVLRQLDIAGLLPPSPDVEVVIGFLAPHLKMVVSGWEYASKVLSIPGGEARAFVERKPHLATGVIVRDDEFDDACGLLASSGLEVDSPVVIAPQRAAHAEAAVEGYVLAPSTNAHFDPVVGERERVQRQSDLERLRQAVSAREGRQKILQERAFRLASFRERYPRDYFAQAAADLEHLAERAKQDEDRVAELKDALSVADELISEVEAARDSARQAITESERAGERVEAYISRFGSDPEVRARALADAEGTELQERAAAESARARAEAAGGIARARRDEAGDLGEKRGGLDTARQAVTHVDEERLVPCDGDLEGLRERYAQLRAQYVREVDESGLEQMCAKEIEAAQQEEGRYEAQLRRFLKDPESRTAQILAGSSEVELQQEVTDWINALPDRDRIEEKRDDLATEQAAARQMISTTSPRLKQAVEERDHAAREREKLSDPPHVEMGREGIPASVQELSVWLTQEETSIKADTEAVAANEAVANELLHTAELDEAAARHLRIQNESLDGIVESNASLLARPTALSAPVGWTDPADDIALSTRISEVKKALLTLRAEDAALDAQRDRLHEDLLGWIAHDEFTAVVLGHPMIRNIQTRTAAACEGDAQVLVERLEIRLSTIDAALKAVETIRATLIGHALAAAEKGIQYLEAAEKQSKMPRHMPLFADKHFLKVQHKTPDSEHQRYERMAELIDKITDDNATLSGIEIVQKAVRTLGRPFRIEVMFPDKMRGAWYTDVERLGRDSGGEVLTSAILLYCNLARLRARNRGRLASQTSVLMLDNPFGMASRLSFLEVQLDVARAAGVQLIYTTGVKDYDAVSLFPNVNRLRPAGFDAKHRQWLLARTDVLRRTDGMDMARIVRSARDADADAGAVALGTA